jgi:hypothetical protein
MLLLYSYIKLVKKILSICTPMFMNPRLTYGTGWGVYSGRLKYNVFLKIIPWAVLTFSKEMSGFPCKLLIILVNSPEHR